MWHSLAAAAAAQSPSTSQAKQLLAGEFEPPTEANVLYDAIAEMMDLGQAYKNAKRLGTDASVALGLAAPSKGGKGSTAPSRPKSSSGRRMSFGLGSSSKAKAKAPAPAPSRPTAPPSKAKGGPAPARRTANPFAAKRAGGGGASAAQIAAPAAARAATKPANKLQRRASVLFDDDPADSKAGVHLTTSARNVSQAVWGDSVSPPEEDAWEEKDPTCKALFDFEGELPCDLSFKRGDVIVITDRQADDWWEGELDGKAGIFPANRVKPCEE